MFTAGAAPDSDPVRQFDSETEDWRAMVGTTLGGAPFKSGIGLLVLEKAGHRLDVPLLNLRNLMQDIAKHLDYSKD